MVRAFAQDQYRIEAPTAVDLRRAADLIEQYADLSLGGTDALVVAIAERLSLTKLATLDRRHFTIVRPSHVDAFALVP